jgi:hypothetical protein
MAIGNKPHQINRTPAPRRAAPDVVTHIRNTQGQAGYGESASPEGNSKVTLVPGTGGPQSLLGQNLLDSVEDEVFGQVLAKGVAGRGDYAPADDNDQLRPVSAEPYPTAHSMSRQQSDYGDIGKSGLPTKLGASAAPAPVDPFAKKG